MGNDERRFRVDAVKLKRLRVQRALTMEDFERMAIMDSGTAKKLFKGGPVSLKTLAKAAKVFNIIDHLELLHPDELLALNVDPEVTQSTKQVLEWEIESYLSPWEKTANGLQFHVAKLQHRFLPDRYARGKCYELRHLPVAERERAAEQLGRHPMVCERIWKALAKHPHPNVAQNITAAFVEEGGLWWVLDVWEDGQTLAERFKAGPLEADRLKGIMAGIAEGLQALHSERIVRRELSPRFVILRPKDLSPVLTDFELAKLLDGKTVVPKDGLRDDPYLAVEVMGEGAIDERADVYSWGRVFVEAAAGHLPAKGNEATTVKALNVPEEIKKLVLRCVAKPRSDRPNGVGEILKALKRWDV